MKMIAVTLCEDKFFDSFGCRKAINSFKYFHPEIEVVLYDSKEICRLRVQYKVDWGLFIPLIMKEVKEKHKADLIYAFGADTLTLSFLYEIFKADYDVAASRNDPDTHIENEYDNRPEPIRYLPNYLFPNAHCVAITNDKILEEWIEYNKYLNEIKKSILPMGEQGVLGIIFATKRYNSKILDPIESNLVYGSSGNLYSDKKVPLPESIKPHNINSWQSWYWIEKKNDGYFYLENGKLIRQLHHGGGFCNEKLGLDLFGSQIKNEIQKIII